MSLRPSQSDRLVALFVVGWLLLGYPLPALFDSAEPVFGVPLLYAYLFGAWLGLVVLMAVTIGRQGEHGGERPGGP